MDTKAKVSKISSISAKIMLVVLVDVLFAMAGIFISSNLRSTRMLETVNHNYMLSVVENAAATLSSVSLEHATTEEYAQMMSSIHMNGVDSSYA